MNFDEKVVDRIKKLEREVERLRVKESPGAWQSWTPSSQTGWTALPTGTYKYLTVGKALFFSIDISDGTSNATSAVLALPIMPARRFNGVIGFAVDNGTAITTACRWFAETNGNIYFYTNMSAGGWTASGTKRLRVSGFYEIA